MSLWIEQRVVATPDGRNLTVELTGDPDGFPVLVHNGTPNSRHQYGPAAADAASRGLKLIGYDRPGYGGSDRHEGRSIADCTADVRAICAALDIDRLAMWGASGGGPHVLACGVLMPDLVSAIAVIASLAPYPAEGLDWFQGFGPGDTEDLRLATHDPAAARELIEKERAELMAATPEALADMLRPTIPGPNAAAAAKDLGAYVSYFFHDSLAPGADGYLDDILAFVRPWGFDFTDITIPVLLVHGRKDTNVPVAHGEWLAARIPGVETRYFDDEAHLSLLVSHMGGVHAWLSDRRAKTTP
jgi:pimeloyl-ACP methyl ester carboxylesterase